MKLESLCHHLCPPPLPSFHCRDLRTSSLNGNVATLIRNISDNSPKKKIAWMMICNGVSHICNSTWADNTTQRCASTMILAYVISLKWNCTLALTHVDCIYMPNWVLSRQHWGNSRFLFFKSHMQHAFWTPCWYYEINWTIKVNEGII